MARLTQRFKSTDSSLLKNAFYRLQFAYTHNQGKSYSKKHKENLFDYGYIGQIRRSAIPMYTLGSDTVNGHTYSNVYRLTAFAYVIDTFIASDKNAAMARYTQNVFDKFGYNFIRYNNYIQQYGA